MSRDYDYLNIASYVDIINVTRKTAIVMKKFYYILIEYITKYGFYIALSMAALSFVIDILIGHEIFQRTGSLIVAFAILHYFANQRIQTGIDYLATF